MSRAIKFFAIAVMLGLGAGCVRCVRVEVEQYGAVYYPNHNQEYLDDLHDDGGYAPQTVAHYDAAPVHHHHNHPHAAPAKERKPKGQDFSKIPGTPGVDYPILHEVPHTGFHCGAVPATPGMYANVETGCQAYHVCHDGREGEQGAKFLCTNGTIFNQKEFTCDWWYNVNCAEAQSYYHLNSDPEHNPYFPKKKAEDLKHDDKFLINL